MRVRSLATILAITITADACARNTAPSSALPVPSRDVNPEPVALPPSTNVPADTIAVAQIPAPKSYEVRLREVLASLGITDSMVTEAEARAKALEPPPALTPAEPEIVSWDLDVSSYLTHERVAYYVNLFTGTGRERTESRLARGKRWEAMIREKFRAHGIPEDMYFLALVESGYDPHAYSRAAAVGMWQFMTTTAKRSGLRVDWWVDERRDPF